MVGVAWNLEDYLQAYRMGRFQWQPESRAVHHHRHHYLPLWVLGSFIQQVPRGSESFRCINLITASAECTLVTVMGSRDWASWRCPGPTLFPLCSHLPHSLGRKTSGFCISWVIFLCSFSWCCQLIDLWIKVINSSWGVASQEHVADEFVYN